MASSSPLTGVVLVDCARANIENGVEVAAEQCGYEKDIAAFQTALESACNYMNIDIQEFTSLSTDPPTIQREIQREGMNVSPDSPGSL